MGSNLLSSAVLAIGTLAGIAAGLDPVLVGQWPRYTGGPALRVTLSGKYAYVVAAGSTVSGDLQVLDISNPTLPQRVGVYDGVNASSDVVVCGHYAYVSGRWSEGVLQKSGLRVLDVSDPSKPRVVGKYTKGADWAESVSVSGNYAYVTGVCWEGGGGFESLQVIDISTPTEPKRVGLCRTAGGYAATQLAVSGQYAFLASGEGGLQIIDIANPANPQRLGSWSSGGNANWVAVSGNHAFVAEYALSHGTNEVRGGGLQIINVSDPANPRWVGACNRGEMAWCVAVSGDRAYVAASYDGLKVIDISDPANPHQIGSCDTQEATGIAVSGHYAYVADEYAGLQVIDVSQPAAPERVGGYSTYQSAEGVAVSGNRAYVVERSYGADVQERVQVLDISRPAIPQRLGRYALNGEIYGLAASGHYAYVSGGSWFEGTNEHYGGLRVLDISTPASVRQVGAVDDFSFASGLAVSGSYVYDAGLGVCDVSTPISPKRVGFCGVGPKGSAVAVREHLAYTVAGGSSDSTFSLQVLDVSDPRRPRQMGEYSLGFELYASDSFVMLGGEYAYVMGTLPGPESLGCLQVIDISDPANPRGIGRFDYDPYHDHCHGLALSGQYACLAAGNAGLLFVDLADPAHPRLAGSYTEHDAEGVAVFGNYAYLAVSPRGYWPLAPRNPGEYSGFGVEVIDISDPARPRRVGGNSTAGNVLNRSNMVAAGGRIYFTGGDSLAILDLCQPPRLESLRLDAQGFHLSLRGVAGQMMAVERSRNLLDWEHLARVPIPVSGQTLIDPAAVNELRLFYRAARVP